MKNIKLKNKIKQTLESVDFILFATIFGSYANETERIDSDIDIAVAGKKVLSAKQFLDLKTHLTSTLHRDVDLIDLNKVSGLILKEALHSGEVILKRDVQIYARLIKKMIYNQEDMMPYFNRILKQRREQFLND
jgi:predicted nucleotidyltransferase